MFEYVSFSHSSTYDLTSSGLYFSDFIYQIRPKILNNKKNQFNRTILQILQLFFKKNTYVN